MVEDLHRDTADSEPAETATTSRSDDEKIRPEGGSEFEQSVRRRAVHLDDLFDVDPGVEQRAALVVETGAVRHDTGDDLDGVFGGLVVDSHRDDACPDCFGELRTPRNGPLGSCRSVDADDDAFDGKWSIARDDREWLGDVVCEVLADTTDVQETGRRAVTGSSDDDQ